MPLTLDPLTEKRIQQAVGRSGFNTPDELLNEALDVLSKHDEGVLEAFRARMDLAFEDLRNGNGIPGEQIEAMLAERRAKRVA